MIFCRSEDKKEKKSVAEVLHQVEPEDLIKWSNSRICWTSSVMAVLMSSMRALLKYFSSQKTR